MPHIQLPLNSGPPQINNNPFLQRIQEQSLRPQERFNPNLSRMDRFLEDTDRGGSLTLEEVNPLVDASLKRDTRNILNSAAAQGKLGADGTIEALEGARANTITRILPQLQQQRFGQQFTAAGTDLDNQRNIFDLNRNIDQQQFANLLSAGGFTSDLDQRLFGNRFNIASLGANAASGAGTNLINTASNIGNQQNVQGAAQAAGSIGQANAANNALSNMATLLAFKGGFGGDS